MKLTKAQMRTLEELSISGERGDIIVDDYKPIARLHELGFASKSTSSFGASTYRITPEGRAALSREGGE